MGFACSFSAPRGFYYSSPIALPSGQDGNLMGEYRTGEGNMILLCATPPYSNSPLSFDKKQLADGNLASDL